MADEELGKALSQISPEVLALEGKMGPFLDIVKAYRHGNVEQNS